MTMNEILITLGVGAAAVVMVCIACVALIFLWRTVVVFRHKSKAEKAAREALSNANGLNVTPESQPPPVPPVPPVHPYHNAHGELYQPEREFTPMEMQAADKMEAHEKKFEVAEGLAEDCMIALQSGDDGRYEELAAKLSPELERLDAMEFPDMMVPSTLLCAAHSLKHRAAEISMRVNEAATRRSFERDLGHMFGRG